MDKLEKKTKDAFSFAWTHFGDKEVKENWQKDSYNYYKWFNKILNDKSKIVLDAGCGSGADILKWAPNSKFIVGIDLSQAVFVAKNNTKNFKNTAFAQASITKMPFKKNSFDLVYSFGVLHHIKDTDLAIKEIYKIIKPGGYFICYLYENLKEKSMLKHIILIFINTLRTIIKMFPPKFIYFFSIILSIPVFLLLTIPANFFKIIGMDKIYRSIPYHHSMNIKTIISDIYDRFSPPVEKRYTKKEAIALIEKHGFKVESIHNYRGWIVIALKDQ